MACSYVSAALTSNWVENIKSIRSIEFVLWSKVAKIYCGSRVILI